MKQKRQLKQVLLMGALASLAAAPWISYAANVTQQDMELANKLAQGSISEMQVGKIVKDKATDPAVKDFANRMVRDHSQMNDQVKHWASLNGVKLPTTPSKDGQELKSRLAQESGKSYDREYIRSMLDDHKKDIAELQTFMESNPNSSLKDVLTQALPIFENHIRVAENVAGKIGVKPEAGLNKPEHPQS